MREATASNRADEWLPVKPLADRLGKSVQAVRKTLAKLEKSGQGVTKPGPTGTLVNVSAFEASFGRTKDAIRAANGALGGAKRMRPPTGELNKLKPPSAAAQFDLNLADFVLSEEQARKTAYQAQIAKLDLEERQGKLLRRGSVQAGMTRIAEVFVRGLEQLPSRTDEIASAMMTGGAAAVRVLLKTITHDIRLQVTAEFQSMEREVADETPPD